nr:protein YLS9-like [Ipomoea batatas]
MLISYLAVFPHFGGKHHCRYSSQRAYKAGKCCQFVMGVALPRTLFEVDPEKVFARDYKSLFCKQSEKQAARLGFTDDLRSNYSENGLCERENWNSAGRSLLKILFGQVAKKRRILLDQWSKKAIEGLLKLKPPATQFASAGLAPPANDGYLIYGVEERKLSAGPSSLPQNPLVDGMNHDEKFLLISNSKEDADADETDRHLKHRRSARHYARRVKDSLTTRVSKLICAVILGLLAIIGLVTFILWLSLRPHRPRIRVEDFSLPALGQGSGIENAQINFNVTVRNSNQAIGIYYDDAMQITLWYDDQSVGTVSLLNPFFQPPKNTTVVAGSLAGAALNVTNQHWEQFVNDVSRGLVLFRLELKTTIRFKVSSWNTKRHRMHSNCPVGIGQDGAIAANYRDKICSVYFS